MVNIENRLDQIERRLGETVCVCSESENSQGAIVVIGKDWGPEQIEFAEASARFNCPTHGTRSRSLLRISEVDANL